MSASIRLSVLVPVYNEANTIEQVLKKLLKHKSVHQVVVVDDGSTDTTPQILKKNAHRKLEVLRKPNGGKGSAIRYGIPHLTGNFTLIQDADLEYDPNEIDLMLKPVREKKAEVVYGSRFLGAHSNLLFWHRVGNSALNFLVNILYNTTLSDMETCYKLLPTKLLKEMNLKANEFNIEPEITCKILRKNIRIFEVPITYVGRTFAEGKKISWVDGFDALKMIIACRF